MALRRCGENPSCSSCCTPAAISSGDVGKVRQLIEGGADVNEQYKDLATPLILACTWDYTDIARLLIESGAKTDGVNAPFAATFGFPEAAKQQAFIDVAKDLGKKLGTNPVVDEKGRGAFHYAIDSKSVPAALQKHLGDLLEQGYYLYQSYSRFGLDGKPDTLTLLPTKDLYAVIAFERTNGANYEIYTHDIINWLRELEKQERFVLTGVSFDFIEGQFLTPIEDPKPLAERMYKFCPDIVDQGVGDVDALARELATKRTLYFWWD